MATRASVMPPQAKAGVMRENGISKFDRFLLRHRQAWGGGGGGTPAWQRRLNGRRPKFKGGAGSRFPEAMPVTLGNVGRYKTTDECGKRETGNDGWTGMIGQQRILVGIDLADR